jgi:hypothetical protein
VIPTNEELAIARDCLRAIWDLEKSEAAPASPD